MGFLEVRHGPGAAQGAGKADLSVQLPLSNKKHMLGLDMRSDHLQENVLLQNYRFLKQIITFIAAFFKSY